MALSATSVPTPINTRTTPAAVDDSFFFFLPLSLSLNASLQAALVYLASVL